MDCEQQRLLAVAWWLPYELLYGSVGGRFHVPGDLISEVEFSKKLKIRMIFRVIHPFFVVTRYSTRHNDDSNEVRCETETGI